MSNVVVVRRYLGCIVVDFLNTFRYGPQLGGHSDEHDFIITGKMNRASKQASKQARTNEKTTTRRRKSNGSRPRQAGDYRSVCFLTYCSSRIRRSASKGLLLLLLVVVVVVVVKAVGELRLSSVPVLVGCCNIVGAIAWTMIPRTWRPAKPSKGRCHKNVDSLSLLPSSKKSHTM